MAFDGVTVCALAQEADKILRDGRISKITQTESDELYITVKPGRSGEADAEQDGLQAGRTSRPGTIRLVLSASAALPLVYLTQDNKQGPMQAPAFCMLLRKHLQGGRIESITQPDFERILRIRVAGHDEMGDPTVRTLVVELMGKHSNIILIDEDNRVIDSIRRVSASMSSVREVLPGRDYFVPAQKGKHSPLEADRQLLQTLLRGRGEPLYKALYSSFTGLSPVLAQELCFLSAIDADKAAIALSDGEFDSLCDAFLSMTDRIRRHDFSPAAVYDNGIPKEYAAWPLTLYASTPGHEVRAFSSMSELIENFYREKALAERIRQRSLDIRHLITQALERDQRKLMLQEKQLSDTEKRDRYRIYGELLQAFGYQAQPKAKSITVEDYHTGQELTIPLDPQLNAQENAGRYFDRYRKLKRTAEALEEQTAITRQDIEHLKSMEEALRIARTEEDLTALRQELAMAGYIKKMAAPVRGKKSAVPGGLPLRYRTAPTPEKPEGYDLYVGKNNLQNDYLTFKFADGGDWWFHAKKTPGSHVILKAGGRTEKEIPDEIFEQAAALAAWYSSACSQTLAEVDYVRRKEVKKPAGTRPGYVVYYTNYSMSIRPGLNGLTQVEPSER